MPDQEADDGGRPIVRAPWRRRAPWIVADVEREASARPRGMAVAPDRIVPAADHRQTLGKQGEDLACAELARRGHRILARRYRTKFGEIDIVSEERGTTVFVEVKARRSTRFGAAVETIPFWKRRRIGAMALDYLAWTGRVHTRCRFDVVAIDGLGTGKTKIRVIENAFSVGER